MQFEIKDEEVKELFEKSVDNYVRNKLSRYFDSFTKTDLETCVCDVIRERIFEMSKEEFSELFKNFDKKLFCNYLSERVYCYLFDNTEY